MSTKTIESWYENGQMSHQDVICGGALDVRRDWYENGVLKNSTGESESEERYESGKLKHIGFAEPRDDYVIGRDFHESGEPECVLYERRPDGVVRENWHKNGKMSYRRTHVTLKKYTVEMWYENGQMSKRTVTVDRDLIESQVWYKNGVQQSDWKEDEETEWYESGKIKYKRNNVPDDEHIVSRNWYENGDRSGVGYVDHPEGLLSETWYESGKIRARQSRIDVA
jgi:antitoxin component YwqK of YwqJK toxin-antitoxin module